jgi:hypothetical protein
MVPTLEKIWFCNNKEYISFSVLSCYLLGNNCCGETSADAFPVRTTAYAQKPLGSRRSAVISVQLTLLNRLWSNSLSWEGWLRCRVWSSEQDWWLQLCYQTYSTSQQVWSTTFEFITWRSCEIWSCHRGVVCCCCCCLCNYAPQPLGSLCDLG